MSKNISAGDFFFPGQDLGMAYLEPPPPPIVRGTVSRVRQIAASENEVLNRKMRRRMEDRWRWPKTPPVFETLSTVVLGEDVTFGKRRVQIGNRTILSAAAGDRVWKSVLKKIDADEECALNRAFAKRRARRFRPVAVSSAADETPFAIDMRNGVNFYHFLTEALPQLALISRINSRAPIFMHMPVLANMNGFVTAFVADLFPDTAARVTFTDQPRKYAQARFVYNHRHYLYQVSDARVAAEFAKLDPDDAWHMFGADRRSRRLLLLRSTYDTGMRILREHVLNLLAERGIAGTSRRIWIARDLSRSNPRPTLGEDVLLKELKDREFDTVYLERMSPLEQIANIHAAKQIVGSHGAAFAHMLFAAPDASVVEVATPQTQIHRWGDFLGNAHVGGCRYTTVFGDVEGGHDRDNVVAIKHGLVGVQIGAAARRAILNAVDRHTAPSERRAVAEQSKATPFTPH